MLLTRKLGTTNRSVDERILPRVLRNFSQTDVITLYCVVHKKFTERFWQHTLLNRTVVVEKPYFSFPPHGIIGIFDQLREEWKALKNALANQSETGRDLVQLMTKLVQNSALILEQPKSQNRLRQVLMMTSKRSAPSQSWALERSLGQTLFLKLYESDFL